MDLQDIFTTFASYLVKKPKRNTIKVCLELIGKTGVEIGGPSSFFGARSHFPAYLFAKSIDGVNFSTQTVWEGSLQAGENYRYYKNHLGYQFIDEASELHSVPSGRYDFLLSCHSLEHIANPVKALFEWARVLKHKGLLCLVLPDKRYTFDNNRPYTDFDHLLSDFHSNVDEGDTAHFEEVLALHNMERDKGVSTMEELKTRTLNNLHNRCVHHHVFSLELVTQLLNYCGFRVTIQKEIDHWHLFTIAEKQ